MAAPSLDLRNRSENVAQTAAEETPMIREGKLSRGNVLLSWEAPEYVIYHKTTGWYVGFGVLLALLLFSAILLQSFLTGVVFLLAGVLIFLYSERTPRRIRYEVRDTGIRVGERFYLFRELAAFNLVERGDTVYMLLKSRRFILPMIHVPLAEETDHQKLRKIMLRHMKEDHEFNEPLADVLAHWLGF